MSLGYGRGTPSLQNVTDIGTTTTQDVTIGIQGGTPEKSGLHTDKTGEEFWLGSFSAAGDGEGLSVDLNGGTPIVRVGSTGNTGNGTIMVLDDANSSAYFQNAQVGIGTTTPNGSAILDLTSTNAGLLVPRMTTAQKNALTTEGLVVYDTTLDKLCIRAAAGWQTITSA